jgi:hypothetical protein
MIWVLGVVAIVAVVVMGLVVIGRETNRLAHTARPAVFELEEAVQYIVDRLPDASSARLSLDDVRWILRADVDLLEEATADPDSPDDPEVVDEDDAVARILGAADDSGRDLVDEDVVAVLDGRSAYLRAIGAIGPEADPT